MSGLIQCNHMNSNGYKCSGYAMQGSKYCPSHVHLMTGYVQNSVPQTVQQSPIQQSSIQQSPIQPTTTYMNGYPIAMQVSSNMQQVLDHHSMIAKAIHEQYAMSASYPSYHPMVMQMASYPQLVPVMTAYGLTYVMQ